MNTTLIKTALKNAGKEGIHASVIAQACKLNPKVARARLRHSQLSKAKITTLAIATKVAAVMQPKRRS